MMATHIRSAALRLVVIAVAAAGLSGCGYSLAGRGSFLPAYIKVVGIPQFQNQSAVPDFDRVLTEQVRHEFSSHGNYKVVPDDTGVDAVLTGTVKSSTLSNVAFTSSNQASRIAVIITASIEFRDVQNDKVLWSNPALQFRDEYDVTTAANANDPAAFFGQDQNALQRLSQNFARSIVSSILEAF